MMRNNGGVGRSGIGGRPGLQQQQWQQGHRPEEEHSLRVHSTVGAHWQTSGSDQHPSSPISEEKRLALGLSISQAAMDARDSWVHHKHEGSGDICGSFTRKNCTRRDSRGNGNSNSNTKQSSISIEEEKRLALGLSQAAFNARKCLARPQGEHPQQEEQSASEELSRPRVSWVDHHSQDQDVSSEMRNSVSVGIQRTGATWRSNANTLEEKRQALGLSQAAFSARRNLERTRNNQQHQQPLSHEGDGSDAGAAAGAGDARSVSSGTTRSSSSTRGSTASEENRRARGLARRPRAEQHQQWASESQEVSGDDANTHGVTNFIGNLVNRNSLNRGSEMNCVRELDQNSSHNMHAPGVVAESNDRIPPKPQTVVHVSGHGCEHEEVTNTTMFDQSYTDTDFDPETLESMGRSGSGRRSSGTQRARFSFGENVARDQTSTEDDYEISMTPRGGDNRLTRVPSKRSMKNKNKKTNMKLFCLVLFVVVIAVVVSTVVTNKDDKSDPDDNSPNGNLDYSLDPEYDSTYAGAMPPPLSTKEPQVVSDVAPQSLPCVKGTFDEELLPAFTQDALKSYLSPQSQALRWIQSDPCLGRLSTTNKLVRFALATLFYATDGKEWKRLDGWLEHDINECDWFWGAPVSGYDSFGASQNKQKSCFAHLSAIELNNNGLRGTIPPELGLLSDVKEIRLNRNSLVGVIPSQIGLLNKKLAVIDLRRNQLQGAIPTEFGSMQRLKALLLSYNGFTGIKIPTELGNLRSTLNMLTLTDTKIHGTLPTEFGALSMLDLLDIAQNPGIYGTIPTELGRLTAIKELFLHNNNLSGALPSELGKLQSLWKLRLQSNNLNGTIPTNMGLMRSAQKIYLSDNQLTGTLPPSFFAKLEHLRVFEIKHNFMHGNLPSELGELTSIVDAISGVDEEGEKLNAHQLFFSYNQLTGTIPTELSELYTIQHLHLDHNQFSGSIPEQFEDFESIQSMSLAYNNLSGPLTPSLGRLSTVELLYLNDNKFTGTIPTEFGLLESLKELHLHNNSDLVGDVPTELCELVWSQVVNEIRVDCTRINCVCGCTCA